MTGDELAVRLAPQLRRPRAREPASPRAREPESSNAFGRCVPVPLAVALGMLALGVMIQVLPS